MVSKPCAAWGSRGFLTYSEAMLLTRPPRLTLHASSPACYNPGIRVPMRDPVT